MLTHQLHEQKEFSCVAKRHNIPRENLVLVKYQYFTALKHYKNAYNLPFSGQSKLRAKPKCLSSQNGRYI